ncbi:MAG: tetratricopeptide repeat protein [Flavobacteriales bacterium]|nr:tetratricopeptide repeat protein [Flavobacteriales bacterium]
MKLRSVLTIISIFILSLIHAQSSKVVSAYSALEEAKALVLINNFEDAAKNLTKALEYIEPATTHEKTSLKEKTWRYRGNIYTLCAQFSDKDEIRGVASDVIMKGVESYKKQMELDSKGTYKEEVLKSMEQLRSMSINEGIEHFNNEIYDKAYNSFDRANTLGLELGVMDTVLVYNAGLAANKAGDFDNAIANFQKCIETGYNGGEMYSTLAIVYKNEGMNEKACEIINAGLAKFPTNEVLLGDKVNCALASGDSGSAKDGVLKMIEKDPTNANLRFVLGNTYEREGNAEGAIEAYTKAIELDPEYFDAFYNLGALHFNRGVESNTACNAIPPKDFKKYDICKKEADAHFASALPYFESAKEINIEDISTLQSLKQIYARMNKMDKYNEMKTLLGE